MGFCESEDAKLSGAILDRGDFNAVLSMEDRLHGYTVTGAEIADFKQCVENNSLLEVRAVGPQYTWHNN